MVVDQSHRLHERMDSCRSSEPPSPAPQVLAHRDRLLRHSALRQARAIEEALVGFRLVTPDVGCKAADLPDTLGAAAGVVDGRVDLGPVADDAGVSHKSTCIASAETGDDLRVEPAKRGAEVLALAEDGQPAEARHKAFEHQLLEQAVVVIDRPAPLHVVIPAGKNIPGPPPPTRPPPPPRARARPSRRPPNNPSALSLWVPLL